jgi:nucleoside-diphosphate-sugar epimerase
MKVTTAVVTGGAGFIGSHLTEELLRRGYHVRVIDDFSTGSPDNLAGSKDGIDFVEGSILDAPLLARACADASVIFHEAAIPSVARSVEDPLRSNAANITGTLSVLEAAREQGVGRVVYAASSSAYGGTHPMPVREDMEPRPVSPYAVAKLAGEHYCRAYTASFGLPTISLRYFNVFGARQSPDSPYAAVIPRFVTALLEGKPAEIFGDGEQSRDFTYIGNAVHANMLAMDATEEAFGQTMNVAHGERHTLNELLVEIAGILHVAIAEPVHLAPRVGDVRHSQADIGKAERLLGYHPLISYADGLRETVEWLRDSRQPARTS